MKSFNLTDLDHLFIGFDKSFRRIQDELKRANGEFGMIKYPPYNIVKRGESNYTIEMACAGFSRDEISITVEDDRLVVKGVSKQDDSAEYLYKGLASRNFTQTFVLNDDVNVVGADMSNGILVISMERIIPEHKKPKTIEIGSRQFLND